MAGPTQLIQYTSDAGVAFAISCPVWQNVIAGNVNATATGTPPKGFRARYRMIRDVLSGKERKIKVGSVTQTFWTEPMDTQHANVTVADGSTATVGSAGRIGERNLLKR